MKRWHAGSAECSPCGRYRWWLHRHINGGNGQTICFVMLNPSTADAEQDDPTIRRCVGFAQQWGYSLLSIRNLFAFRSTGKRQLQRLAKDEAVGGARNDTELLAGLAADCVVLAWGGWVPHGRAWEVMELFQHRAPEHVLWCLGVTKNHAPRHPLYVPASQALLPYTWHSPRAYLANKEEIQL